jgi:conflict system pore-forming effector with SLATT domain
VEVIEESAFPALYRAADHSATVGQRRFLLAVRFQLVSLLLAAVFGSFSLDAGRVDAAAICAAAALATALVTEVFLLTVRPDRHWYEARAAAESAKTLAWRYAVGGQPFDLDGGEDEHGAERLLLRRFSGITSSLRDFVPVLAPGEDHRQVTSAMRRIRTLPLEERQRQYLVGRIHDQRAWYADRARRNERRSAQWSVGLAALETAGLVAAVLAAVKLVDFDLPGIVGAVAAGGVAWLQTRQHQQLASAYSVAALELADIAERARWPRTEVEWAHFVDEAEEAISREHTLWWASHS